MITMEMFVFSLLLVVVIFLVIMFRKSLIELIKEQIIKVEKEYQDKTGKEKLEAVLKYVNTALRWLKWIVPNTRIIAYIEMVLREFNRFSKATDQKYINKKDQ